MIDVLLIEDNGDKAAQVRSVIDDILGNAVSIASVATYVDACACIAAKQYDVMILDLLIPRDDTESPESEYGVELLRHLSDVNPRFKQPRYVVGLTAYTDLKQQCGELFEREGWHLLQHSTSSDEWGQRLARVLVHAAAANVTARSLGDGYSADLLIITALTHCEQQQVMALPVEWSKVDGTPGEVVFYEGRFEKDDDSLKVICASASQMGMPASTALAMAGICKFKPRCVAMCGIAAGVSGDFGDILIADQAWDYGSGKVRRGLFGMSRFEPAPEPIPLSSWLRCRLAEFRTHDSVLREIREGWSGPAPKVLGAQIGPIASGAAVLQNRWLINRIKKGQRKLIGIEMEAYGVFMAAHLAPEPRPSAFVVKSICDFGDSRKSDQFQEYAAYTSSRFVYEFAKEWL